MIACLSAGVNILWSGSIDENNASVVVYDILIPSFTSALSSVQPKVHLSSQAANVIVNVFLNLLQVGYPAKPTNYEGTYKASLGPSVAKISTVNDTLLISASGRCCH